MRPGGPGGEFARAACGGGRLGASARKNIFLGGSCVACVRRRARGKYFFKLSLVRKAGHTHTRTDGGRCFCLIDRRESSILALFS